MQALQPSGDILDKHMSNVSMLIFWLGLVALAGGYFGFIGLLNVVLGLSDVALGISALIGLAFLLGFWLLWGRFTNWVFNWLATLRIDLPTVSVSDNPAVIGDKVDVWVEAPIKGNVNIDSVTVSLVLHEWALLNIGTTTDITTHDNVIVSIPRPGGSYSRGNKMVEQVTLEIPPGNMHSLMTSTNQLIWQVSVRIVVKGGLNLAPRYPMTVQAQIAQTEVN
ncbi:MAG: hypothetical protein GYB68_17040 [Chloroflexi bacterium]|nr:hypothetical protein [Chloroflexota bacterium]